MNSKILAIGTAFLATVGSLTSFAATPTPHVATYAQISVASEKIHNRMAAQKLSAAVASSSRLTTASRKLALWSEAKKSFDAATTLAVTEKTNASGKVDTSSLEKTLTDNSRNGDAAWLAASQAKIVSATAETKKSRDAWESEQARLAEAARAAEAQNAGYSGSDNSGSSSSRGRSGGTQASGAAAQASSGFDALAYALSYSAPGTSGAWGAPCAPGTAGGKVTGTLRASTRSLTLCSGPAWAAGSGTVKAVALHEAAHTWQQYYGIWDALAPLGGPEVMADAMVFQRWGYKSAGGYAGSFTAAQVAAAAKVWQGQKP